MEKNKAVFDTRAPAAALPYSASFHSDLDGSLIRMIKNNSRENEDSAAAIKDRSQGRRGRATDVCCWKIKVTRRRMNLVETRGPMRLQAEGS